MVLVVVIRVAVGVVKSVPLVVCSQITFRARSVVVEGSTGDCPSNSSHAKSSVACPVSSGVQRQSHKTPPFTYRNNDIQPSLTL